MTTALIVTTGGMSVLAMWLLYYLLPDSRARPDHRRVLTLIEVCVNTLLGVGLLWHVQ